MRGQDGTVPRETQPQARSTCHYRAVYAPFPGPGSGIDPGAHRKLRWSQARRVGDGEGIVRPVEGEGLTGVTGRECLAAFHVSVVRSDVVDRVTFAAPVTD